VSLLYRSNPRKIRIVIVGGTEMMTGTAMRQTVPGNTYARFH